MASNLNLHLDIKYLSPADARPPSAMLSVLRPQSQNRIFSRSVATGQSHWDELWKYLNETVHGLPRWHWYLVIIIFCNCVALMIWLAVWDHKTRRNAQKSQAIDSSNLETGLGGKSSTSDPKTNTDTTSSCYSMPSQNTMLSNDEDCSQSSSTLCRPQNVLVQEDAGHFAYFIKKDRLIGW